MKIRSSAPLIDLNDVLLVSKAARKAWKENRDYYINLFIKEFTKYTGMKYCLPVSHCTEAIHLALLSLDIKKGDEVIVPDLTWVASAAPITYVGARPVFADICKTNLCIDHNSVEKLITMSESKFMAQLK